LPLTTVDEKIQETVVVIISPGATDRVSAFGSNAARQNFGKGAVAVVLIQEVIGALFIVGDEQIQVAIVVVVSPGAASRQAHIGDDIAAGDFGEGGLSAGIGQRGKEDRAR